MTTYPLHFFDLWITFPTVSKSLVFGIYLQFTNLSTVFHIVIHTCAKQFFHCIFRNEPLYFSWLSLFGKLDVFMGQFAENG